MSNIDIYDIEKNKISAIELNNNVFGINRNETVIYDIVRMQLAKKRQGTASTKERHSVSGGGRKPWKQKGTGRARVGSTRSPIWRGGGVTFGPHPRDFSFSIPKKVRKLALKIVLTEKYRKNKIFLVNTWPNLNIKTKIFKNFLDKFTFKKVLFILEDFNEVFEKSARNLQYVKMIRLKGINVYDIMNHEYLIMLESTIKKIEGMLL